MRGTTRDDDLPVVELSDVEHREPIRDATVAGVVLAAGTSSRFGAENKLLATLDGESVLKRAVRTLHEADLSPVVVVVGYEAERIESALEGLHVETIMNPAFEQGQATSVSAGVEAIRDRADATLIALGDMPLVSVETVETLVAAYRAEVGDALAASYEGCRGNPVLFDGSFFDDLTGVTGDIGGRRVLLKNDRSALVDVDDPSVLRDVDRPRDLDSFSDSR